MNTAHEKSVDLAKLDIAIATRLLVAESILDYSGHISWRLPGRDALLIQDGAASRAELDPDSVLVVGLDGRVIEGRGQPPSELAIHIEILKARPDVEAILHAHMELAIAFTMMDGVRLLPMRARAARWKSGIPTHPDPSHIKEQAQGRALAQTLGPHNAALMRAHGLIVVAENTRALFTDAVHFQENAKAMMQTLQAGARPLALSEAEIEQIERMEMREWHVRKLWNYYVRRGLSETILPENWREPALPKNLKR